MKSNWKGRRVLVTGHTGFKGSWLCLMLRHLGAEVSGYALAPEAQSLFNDARIAGGMRSTIGDIRDLPALRKDFAAFQPEVVLHLAAQALVRPSYAQPLDTFSTNVQGTANVLEACRELPSLKAVVSVTSDKCYLNREWVWGYREDDALGGNDPYSASKAAAEIVTASYRHSFFKDGKVAIASARSGNVIGGGDWSADRLVPDAVRAFARREPVRIRFPESTRPWQHVLDPLAGYLRLAERLLEGGAAYAEAFNFGPLAAEGRTVRTVVEKLCASWPGGGRWEREPGTHLHEAKLLKLDCTKAVERLLWRPRLAFDAGIDWTVRWYAAWAAKQDLAALTRAQVETFLNSTEELS